MKAKLANFPSDPVETFVKHVEFAQKFGDLEEFQLDSRSFVEQFNLDLIGLAIIISIVLYQLTKFIFKTTALIVKILNSNGKKKSD